MRQRWLLVAALAVTSLAAPTAWAQRGAGRGGFGGGGAMLLGQKSVQADLKLTDEQTAKVTAHLEKQREGFAGLRDLSREERMAKMREQATANDAAIKEILTADQLKRLEQITLQQRGPSALGDDKVAEAVGLTAEQKEKVKAINDEMRGAFQGGGGGQDREAARKKFEEARAAARTKLEALLTPEQQTKWKELTGEPFKGEIQRFQGRRRNSAAAVDRPLTGQLISLTGEGRETIDRDDALWNEVARLLSSQPHAARLSFAVGDGEVPLRLVGVHKPPRPNPAKMRRKVHRQNQRHASFGEHRSKHHHAWHHRGGPRRHHVASHERGPWGHTRHGYAGHFRHQDAARYRHHDHGHRGPQFARFGHGPSHRHFAGHGPARHHQFAGRGHHGPNHFSSWSRHHGGPDHGHLARHHGPHRPDHFGHGPRAEFSSHRPGGNHFHMSSWHRHRHNEHRHGRHRDDDRRRGDREKDNDRQEESDKKNKD